MGIRVIYYINYLYAHMYNRDPISPYSPNEGSANCFFLVSLESDPRVLYAAVICMSVGRMFVCLLFCFVYLYVPDSPEDRYVLLKQHLKDLVSFVKNRNLTKQQQH